MPVPGTAWNQASFDEKSEHDRKPSSVVDDHLSRLPVTRQLQRRRGAAGNRIMPHCVLHQVGFTARTSRQAVGELLPRLSSLTGKSRRCISVALSLKSPSPVVNRHPALRCSDFPHALRHAIAWSSRRGIVDISQKVVKERGFQTASVLPS